MARRIRRLRSVCGLALGSALVACSGAEPHPEHLLLVSIGSLRADLARDADAMPGLAALAAEGTAIDAHVSVVPSTAAGHASLLTGRYPRGHGLARDGLALAPDTTTLAEQLSAAGFETAGFAGHPALAARYGFARGFDRYAAPQPEDAASAAQESRWLAPRLTDEAIRWLRGRSGRRSALFVGYADLWGGPHPADPDGTPRPAEVVRALRDDPARGRSLSGRLERAYRARATSVDGELARLLAAVRNARLLDDTLVVITSDHGIATTLHPMEVWSHGRGVFDETVRTPLLLRWPPDLPRGVRLPRLVANIDVLPTVLELLGLPAPSGVDGLSFARGLAAEGDWPRQHVFLEAAAPDPLRERDTRWPNERKLRAVRSAGWKLVYDPMRNARRLFDLRLDPDERRDASHMPLHFGRLASLQKELDEWAAQPLPGPLSRASPSP